MSDTDWAVMTATIFGEARGLDEDGRVAVAWAIKNRADKPGWWGNGITDVCLKPFQFSCWNSNDPNLKAMFLASLNVQGGGLYRVCSYTADKVINGRVPDPTNGATHYYNPDVVKEPKWAAGKTPCAKIGPHLFFKDVA